MQTKIPLQTDFRRPISRIASVCLAIALAAGLLETLPAVAAPINYSFSATGVTGCNPVPTCSGSGPLTGDVLGGTFSYDSSSITPGTDNINTGLLTALSFTLDGISYNQTTANTGFLGFDGGGNLTEAFFGDNCAAGSCTEVGGTTDWVLDALTSGGGGGDYAVTTTGFPYIYFLSVTLSRVTSGPGGVPEPATLTLLGACLAGLGFLYRRKAR